MENKRIDLELVKAFLKMSKADLKSAELELKGGIYNNSVYHAQQAAEKAAKALLTIHNRFQPTHIISPELEKIRKKEKISEKVILAVKDLEKHWVISRYPFRSGRMVWNPVNMFEEKDALDALKKAKFVVSQIEKLLKTKYGVKL